VQTRTEVVDLQHRLGVTTVYVTHDQVEAMTMGTASPCSRTASCSSATRRGRSTTSRQPVRRRLHRLSPAMNLVPSWDASDGADVKLGWHRATARRPGETALGRTGPLGGPSRSVLSARRATSGRRRSCCGGRIPQPSRTSAREGLRGPRRSASSTGAAIGCRSWPKMLPLGRFDTRQSGRRRAPADHRVDTACSVADGLRVASRPCSPEPQRGADHLWRPRRPRLEHSG
jgi:hypothetical protein